jgi:hypothetical protein
VKILTAWLAWVVLEHSTEIMTQGGTRAMLCTTATTRRHEDTTVQGAAQNTSRGRRGLMTCYA